MLDDKKTMLEKARALVKNELQKLFEDKNKSELLLKTILERFEKDELIFYFGLHVEKSNERVKKLALNVRFLEKHSDQIYYLKGKDFEELLRLLDSNDLKKMFSSRILGEYDLPYMDYPRGFIEFKIMLGNLLGTDSELIKNPRLQNLAQDFNEKPYHFACHVCGLQVLSSQESMECKHCNNKFHKEHWNDWVKTFKYCPYCKKPVDS